MSNPLPKREYNLPPPGFVTPIRSGVNPQPSRYDAEIESIRRTLHNALDKLDRLQRQRQELTAT